MEARPGEFKRGVEWRRDAVCTRVLRGKAPGACEVGVQSERESPKRTRIGSVDKFERVGGGGACTRVAWGEVGGTCGGAGDLGTRERSRQGGGFLIRARGGSRTWDSRDCRDATGVGGRDAWSWQGSEESVAHMLSGGRRRRGGRGGRGEEWAGGKGQGGGTRGPGEGRRGERQTCPRREARETPSMRCATTMHLCSPLGSPSHRTRIFGTPWRSFSYRSIHTSRETAEAHQGRWMIGKTPWTCTDTIASASHERCSMKSHTHT